MIREQQILEKTKEMLLTMGFVEVAIEGIMKNDTSSTINYMRGNLYCIPHYWDTMGFFIEYAYSLGDTIKNMYEDGDMFPLVLGEDAILNGLREEVDSAIKEDELNGPMHGIRRDLFLALQDLQCKVVNKYQNWYSKVSGKEDKRLFKITSETIYRIMELIDGYDRWGVVHVDLVDEKNGKSLRQGAELRDECTEYLVHADFLRNRKLKPFNQVMLLTDKYLAEGVRKGDIGYVLEDYGDNHFEVKFSDSSNGFTIALLFLPQKDIKFVRD